MSMTGNEHDECAERDHDLREIDSRDGLTTYECRRCGAEIFSEVMEPEPIEVDGDRIATDPSYQTLLGRVRAR